MPACQLPESLTIETVAELRTHLLEGFDGSGGDLRIDGSAVDEVDGAGIQLLLAAAKEALGRGGVVTLAASARLEDTLRMLAVEHRFALKADPGAHR